MLPAVRTAITAATAAAAIALAPAAPAHAWGDKEQGFVAGVATFLLLNEIAKKRRAPAYRAPQNAYVPANPAPVYQTSPAKSAFLEYSPNARRVIQQRLKAYGYYTGSVDGVWGPGTARAIAAYARDVGYGDGIGTRNGAVQLYNALLA